jgi:hypothetical protein
MITSDGSLGMFDPMAMRRLWSETVLKMMQAGKTFAFIAVVLDCVNDAARAFHRQWGFSELPGHPYRLFVSAKQLDAMMKSP